MLGAGEEEGWIQRLASNCFSFSQREGGYYFYCGFQFYAVRQPFESRALPLCAMPDPRQLSLNIIGK